MKKAAISFAGALFLAAGGALAQGSGALTDAQIADIVVTANQVDIDNGKYARRHAASQEVKAFAEQMVTDHTGVNKAAKDLAKRIKLKPEDNPDSKSLKAGGKDTMKKLKDLKGASFDAAYIDSEVTFHQTVIDTMDKSLLPNAKNAELKAMLEKYRPAFVAHLEHAKQLQSSLGKKGGT